MEIKKLNFFVDAIFDLSVEEKLEKRYFELTKKSLEFSKDENIISFLADYNVLFSEKEAIIKLIFKKKEDLFYRNWFLLLIKNNLIKNLDFMLNLLIDKFNNYNRIVYGKVITTIPLSKQKMTKLENNYSKILNQKVFLTNILDKTIIGGIRIMIGDKIWDNTISEQIMSLSKKILEGKIKK